ncbi:uncharacterized protein ACJ7VT_004998 [Polymixia lowei]
MSSEQCPFCGKSFKRLKSHLPHCKAAERSKTPPTQHDVPVTQKTSPISPLSSKLISALEKTTKGKKSTKTLSTSPQTKKSKKGLALSSAPLPLSEPSSPPTALKGVNASSSSQSPSLSVSSSSSLGTTSFSTSTKKKKQKLSDQIKMATVPSSSTASLSSFSPPPAVSPSPSLSKAKKKDLRALIEAARSNQVPLEGTRPTSVDLLSVSTPLSLLTDPLTSRPSVLSRSQANPDRDADDTQLAPLPTDTKLKGAPTKKRSQREEAAQSLSTTKAEGVGNGARPNGRVKFWEEIGGKREDQSGKERFWGSESGQVRVTLQDAKATLGRSNTTHQSSKPSILDQIKTTATVLTTDSLSSKTKTRGLFNLDHSRSSIPPNQNEPGVSPLLTSVELSAVERERPKQTTKSPPGPLIPPRDEGSAQPKPTSLLSLLTPPLSAPPSSLVSAAASLSTVNMKEAVNMGLLSVSPSVTQPIKEGTLPCITPSSSVPRPCPLPPQTPPVRLETTRTNERLMVEKPQLKMGKQNVTKCGICGGLTERSLGQVTLRELPGWLAIKTPSHPREVAEMLRGGWQWYYGRYIDVRKGAVSGVGMLLAGYCVLSYMWSYPHIKRDRWRKYH